MLTSPSYSRPFLAPTGFTLFQLHLSAYAYENSAGTLLDLSAVTLQTLTVPAPTGQAWFRLRSLPDVVVLGYRSLALVVANASDDTVLSQQTLSAGDPAVFDLMGRGGLYPVSLTVQDTLTSSPLSGVALTVWDPSLTNRVLPTIYTDSEGEAVLALPTGTYALLAFARNAGFANPITLVVAVSPVTQMVLGDLAIAATPSSDTVVISGYVLAPDQSPVAGVAVSLSLYGRPQLVGSVVVSSLSISTATNASGYFEIEVMGGLSVTLTIEQVGFIKSGLLPDAGSISLETINGTFR
jgi:hypothetical protein